MENDPLITRDWLAIERTKLANERTFLAYFRTSMVFLGTGVGILKIEFFENIKPYGLAFLLIAPLIFFIGLARLFVVRKKIRAFSRPDGTGK